MHPTSVWMSPQDTDPQEQSDKQSSLSRRGVLRKSAALSGAALTGGLGSTALVGTVAASGSCTSESEENINEINYYDEWGDDNTATDIDCENVRRSNKKDVHGMSVVYRGTTRLNENNPDVPTEYHHNFTETGHTEHFEQSSDGTDLTQCDEPWEPALGTAGHRITVTSHQNDTYWDVPAGGSVAGHPPDDSGLDIPLSLREASFTALTAAAGYVGGPWTGVASSIVLSMVPESHGDDSPGANEFMFDWDYDNYYGPKCGSHTVDWIVQSTSTDEVSMDVKDEAWGKYPNYSRIEKQVDLVDPDFTDGASTMSQDNSDTPYYTSDRYWQQTDHPEPPSEGDTIETSRGKKAIVTDVSVQTTMSSGTPEKTVQAASLPDGISASSYDEENITVHRKAAAVREITISAALLDGGRRRGRVADK